MKNLCRLGLAVLMAAWLPLTSAQEASKPAEADAKRQQREQVQKEVGEAVDAIRGYSIERRKEAVDRARESLTEADRRLDRLDEQVNERWARMNLATRHRSHAAMTDLRRRRNDVAEWAGGMQHSSGEVWEDVKAGFIKSYHDLADALQKARAQFERDQAQDMPEDQQTSAEKQQEQER
jgi:hypothetical protein